VLLSLFLQGCTRQSAREPVTLTLLEEWTNKSFAEARQQELQQFTRDTGIRVNLLPSPESAQQKLVLWEELLRTGTSDPDVYGVDVIWPGILSDYFIDLRPYFAQEISREFPGIAAQLYSR
jgi:ABC-type glycerol-3-phosphate transport system substrate-binding protein